MHFVVATIGGKTMRCPLCGKPIPDSSLWCPYVGNPVRRKYLFRRQNPTADLQNFSRYLTEKGFRFASVSDALKAFHYTFRNVVDDVVVEVIYYENEDSHVTEVAIELISTWDVHSTETRRFLEAVRLLQEKSEVIAYRDDDTGKTVFVEYPA